MLARRISLRALAPGIPHRHFRQVMDSVTMLSKAVTTNSVHTTSSSVKLTGSDHNTSGQTMAQLRVNGSRMMDSIHATCEFGKAHPWGEYGSPSSSAE